MKIRFDVLRLYYGREMTSSEVGQSLGMTGGGADQHRVRALVAALDLAGWTNDYGDKVTDVLDRDRRTPAWYNKHAYHRYREFFAPFKIYKKRSTHSMHRWRALAVEVLDMADNLESHLLT